MLCRLYLDLLLTEVIILLACHACPMACLRYVNFVFVVGGWRCQMV